MAREYVITFCPPILQQLWLRRKRVSGSSVIPFLYLFWLTPLLIANVTSQLLIPRPIWWCLISHCWCFSLYVESGVIHFFSSRYPFEFSNVFGNIPSWCAILDFLRRICVSDSRKEIISCRKWNKSRIQQLFFFSWITQKVSLYPKKTSSIWRFENGVVKSVWFLAAFASPKLETHFSTPHLRHELQ